MTRCDFPDGDLGQELLVDCGYTKVIACRVGAFGSSFVRAVKPRDFGRPKGYKPPPDESDADSYILRSPQGKIREFTLEDSYIPRSPKGKIREFTLEDSYITRIPQGKIREFTLKELGEATENFNRKRVLGRGGFGEVFKGILWDGAAVVVKVLAKDSGQGFEQFHAEMRASSAIMSVPHPNLVPVIGYHSSGEGITTKAMIVYPFMSNGDVGRYLSNSQPPRTPLNWPTRKRIALGVARGISSLHELGIVHRDIKPSNIMLDEDFNAHVGDLGLAKSVDDLRISYYAARFHRDEDGYYYESNDICGTHGYLAPEYIQRGHYSKRSDVYAFGVTLIQLVTGKPPFDISEEDERKHIVARTKQLFKNEEDLTKHIHPSMLGMYDESEAIELIRLGLVCVQEDPKKRPLMPEVIAIMRGSSTNLKQRWDNYNYAWSSPRLYNVTRSETDFDISSNSRRISYVGAGGSGSEDDDTGERCRAFQVDINEEELEGIEEDGNQLRPQQHQGHRSGVPCCDSSVHPGDASGGISGSFPQAGLTGSTYSRSIETDALAEIVEVDPNEGEHSKQLSSQANRHERQFDEVATKLREALDQMLAMELNHQAAVMEEMHQMQTIIDRLKEASQKI